MAVTLRGFSSEAVKRIGEMRGTRLGGSPKVVERDCRPDSDSAAEDSTGFAVAPSTAANSCESDIFDSIRRRL